MVPTCSKCGATNDGSVKGLNPCHERKPAENHAFSSSSKGTGVTSATGPEVGRRLVWVDDENVSAQAKRELELYERVGELMKDDPCVLDVKDKIEALRTDKTYPRPFAMISAPSGTGKTQLPFSLRAAGLNLIHLVVGVDYNLFTQEVYWNFRFHSYNLRRAVQEDFRRNPFSGENNDALHCLDLSLSNTPLFTVEWLCRLLDIDYSKWDSCSVSNLKQHISDPSTKPMPVVVLDEIYYPGDKRWTLEHVRFLRNVLRAVGIVAVLMGTNCSSVGLVGNMDGSGSRGGKEKFWCRLITDLPKVSEQSGAVLGTTSALAKIRNPSWSHSHHLFTQLLEKGMLTGNCWFVRLIAEAVNKLADEEFNRPTVELVDRVCSKVHSTLISCKSISLKGQLCLQLNPVSDNTASRNAWQDSTSLLVKHFASLTGGGRDVYIAAGGALKQLVAPIRFEDFVLDAKFASVSDDHLLYLVCCGGVNYDGTPRRPFYEYQNSSRIELSTRATMEKVCFPDDEAAASRSGDELELLAAVSIGTASRLSGLRGTTLRNFLPLLCAELLPSYKPVKLACSDDPDAVSTDLVGTKFENYRIPYIGVDSSPCNVANTNRTRDRVNVIVHPGSAPASASTSTAAVADDSASASAWEGFVAECQIRPQQLDWKTLEGVLMRVPEGNSLHFVFCRSAQGGHFTVAATTAWSDWGARHGHRNTNVARVRCSEGKMRLVPLSPGMPWVSWGECTKLVIVIAVDALSGGLKRTHMEI